MLLLLVAFVLSATSLLAPHDARALSSLDARDISFQVHSYNDLRLWPQLVRKSVTWLKVDPHWMDPSFCKTQANARNNTKNGCFLLNHDKPSSQRNYNTTEDILAFMTNPHNIAHFKHPAPRVYIALCFKWDGISGLCSGLPNPTMWRALADQFMNTSQAVISEHDLNVEFILDGSGTPTGRPCLLNRWNPRVATWITGRDPGPALHNNDEANGDSTYQVNNMPESTPADASLVKLQGQGYGKFGNSSYPFLFWEPSDQASIVQTAAAYSQGPLAPSGLRFATNIDPVQVSLYAAGAASTQATTGASSAAPPSSAGTLTHAFDAVSTIMNSSLFRDPSLRVWQTDAGAVVLTNDTSVMLFSNLSALKTYPDDFFFLSDVSTPAAITSVTATALTAPSGNGDASLRSSHGYRLIITQRQCFHMYDVPLGTNVPAQVYAGEFKQPTRAAQYTSVSFVRGAAEAGSLLVAGPFHASNSSTSLQMMPHMDDASSAFFIDLLELNISSQGFSTLAVKSSITIPLPSVQRSPLAVSSQVLLAAHSCATMNCSSLQNHPGKMPRNKALSNTSGDDTHDDGDNDDNADDVIIAVASSFTVGTEQSVRVSRDTASFAHGDAVRNTAFYLLRSLSWEGSGMTGSELQEARLLANDTFFAVGSAASLQLLSAGAGSEPWLFLAGKDAFCWNTETNNKQPFPATCDNTPTSIPGVLSYTVSSVADVCKRVMATGQNVATASPCDEAISSPTYSPSSFVHGTLGIGSTTLGEGCPFRAEQASSGIVRISGLYPSYVPDNVQDSRTATASTTAKDCGLPVHSTSASIGLVSNEWSLNAAAV